MKTRSKYIMVIAGSPIIVLGVLSGIVWSLYVGGHRWMLKRIAE